MIWVEPSEMDPNYDPPSTSLNPNATVACHGMSLNLDPYKADADAYAQAIGGEKAWLAHQLAAGVPDLLAEVERQRAEMQDVLHDLRLAVGNEWSTVNSAAVEACRRIAVAENEVERLKKWGPDDLPERARADIAEENLSAALMQRDAAMEEVERLREHSITLNLIGWRIAVALGDVPEGVDRIEGNPSDQADRLIAEVERLRTRLDAAEQTPEVAE